MICGQRSLLCLSFALQRWPQGFLATLAPKAFGVDRRKVFLSVKSLKSAVKSAPSFCIFHFAFPSICVHPRFNSLICHWPLFASPSHSIYTLSFILLRGQTISFHFYGTQAPRKRRLWRSSPPRVLRISGQTSRRPRFISTDQPLCSPSARMERCRA